MTTWLIQFDDNGEGLSTGDIAELEGLVTTLGFTATISSAPVPAPRLEWRKSKYGSGLRAYYVPRGLKNRKPLPWLIQ